MTEIQQTIGDIVQSITTTSEEISKNSQKVAKLSEHATDAQTEISGSVEKIDASVKNVDEIIQGYIDNAHQVEKMIKGIESIHNLSSENAKSVGAISISSKHLSERTEKLNQLLAQYRT